MHLVIPTADVSLEVGGFRMALNAPQTGGVSSFGTHFSDGIRQGQIYNNSDQVAQYYRMGYGILNSPIFTYDVSFPLQVIATIGIISTSAAFTLTSFTINQNSMLLPTFGNNTLNTPFPYPPFASPQIDITGKSYYQFDWPRCVWISLGANATTDNKVFRISGYDFYNNRMSEEVAVVMGQQDIESKKAFYKITSIKSISGADQATTVSIYPSNDLGLPFKLESLADILGARISFNNAANAATVGSQTSISGMTVTTEGEALKYNAGPSFSGDSSVSTETTGDVRGTVGVSASDLSALSTIAAPNIFGPIKLAVSYYVGGAAAYINQQCGLGMPQGQPRDQAAAGDLGKYSIPQDALTSVELYGVPQYYNPEDF